jgi:hypothetical protein
MSAQADSPRNRERKDDDVYGFSWLGLGSNSKSNSRQLASSSSYGRFAGWALGKVIGQNRGQPADEDALNVCRMVSEEVGVRAGLFHRTQNDIPPPHDPRGFDAVQNHCFFGAEVASHAVGETLATWKTPDDWHSFDPNERGESGIAPLLRGDFFRLLNVTVYENTTLPKQCTTGGFSTSWSGSFETAWKRLTDQARSTQGGGSLVDFTWRRAVDPDPDTAAARASADPAAAVCRAYPLDFESAGGGADGWRMTVGAATSGTSFRSARGVPRADAWRANAISNLFLCPVTLSLPPDTPARPGPDSPASGPDGPVVLNVVRHGVVGYARDPAGHVQRHLELVVRRVAAAQAAAGLPQRLVSVNLLSHYKASGEPDMTDRQLAAFREVARYCIFVLSYVI